MELLAPGIGLFLWTLFSLVIIATVIYSVFRLYRLLIKYLTIRIEAHEQNRIQK